MTTPASAAVRSPAARRARVGAVIVLAIVFAPIVLVVLYARMKMEGRH